MPTWVTPKVSTTPPSKVHLSCWALNHTLLIFCTLSLLFVLFFPLASSGLETLVMLQSPMIKTFHPHLSLPPSSLSSFPAETLVQTHHLLLHAPLTPTRCSLVSVSTVLLKLLLSKLPTFLLFLLLIDTFLFLSHFHCQEHLE